MKLTHYKEPPKNPIVGDTYYDDVISDLFVYDGNEWMTLSSTRKRFTWKEVDGAMTCEFGDSDWVDNNYKELQAWVHQFEDVNYYRGIGTIVFEDAALVTLFKLKYGLQ